MDSRTASAFERHDHDRCTRAARAGAERLVSARGLRLTPVRRRVLDILLEEHRALGAYEVLDRLAADGFAHQPPIAYRALDFLVTNGLAHRVRRLNAFAACTRPETEHEPAFFICEVCKAVAEAPEREVAAAIGGVAEAIGFDVGHAAVEVIGRCPACRAAGQRG